ncbi:hypothetical protein [Deinococcus radiotolerans]|uniref:Uncharacterized protein n=1 Tax=Deinococcus radiotolerans TaxID=1309407 RepID=A0ABQ2FQX5_9DEIO|nr:hypothetical protein [Deinococcus radiotolerans]GGL18011.1 hypothetical protein GCM10010844_41050 [Deinococcus radiotolerans]
MLNPGAELAQDQLGPESIAACNRIDAEIESLYQQVMREGVTVILQDDTSAELFLLALDGLSIIRPRRSWPGTTRCSRVDLAS